MEAIQYLINFWGVPMEAATENTSSKGGVNGSGAHLQAREVKSASAGKQPVDEGAATAAPSPTEAQEATKVVANADHKALRARMREATIDGGENLEKAIGELICQDFQLLTDAGELMYKRITQASGLTINKINMVIEIGCGSYPGLGNSIAAALLRSTNAKTENLQIFHVNWGYTEIPKKLRESKGLTALIVTAAKTAELTKKMQTFIDDLRGKVTGGIQFCAVCSLVSLVDAENHNGRCLETHASTGPKAGTPRAIDGVTVTE